MNNSIKNLTNNEVHHSIADLARRLHDVPEASEHDDGLLRSVTAAAIENVPGARHAGVLLVDKKRNFETIAPTGPVMTQVDRIQLETGEGPCLQAAWDHQMVLINDIAGDPRWPAFSARVVNDTPVRAGLSFHLFTHKGTIGALNVFADEVDAFSVESEELGLIFATHAALALGAVRQQQDFRSALASRDTIGQAKGMLMERFSIDAIAAFELLRRLSQDTNTPLVDVARQVIDAEKPVKA
ncbi:GAF and ANTAR domain-containing protein [Gordonia sp. LSe1-13]|uniref:GAF and ANTAR domain-containing protein n=1 Tax=Gordonia sesuvii TaxID=3116777 RepID=A0ABU7MK03_9ACTN|nr:GAF and ANTAR domain-containing protein [Gordonia sp. LSe1-13]